jgi:hypothetical protein
LPFFKPARQAPAASCPAWQTFRAVKEPRLADAIADNHSLQAQSLVWQIAKDARFASMDESGKRAMQNAPESFLDELRSDPARFSDEYKRRFGNILNADDAATLFDRYNASPLTMRTVVHPAATELRDSLLQERLAEDAPPGKNFVLFTAGGNATGKSTIALLSGAASAAHAVFDSTLSNPDEARKLVNQTLAAGKEVHIYHVSRPLDETLYGMIERSKGEGRVVSIPQLLRSTQHSAATVWAIAESVRRRSPGVLPVLR